MKTLDQDFPLQPGSIIKDDDPSKVLYIQEPKTTGLNKLREPFPAHQISKLPKPTKKQTDDVKANYKLGIRCAVCGGWHHPDVIHLDYVGHAALTDRLLDADIGWSWEPLATTSNGLPSLDESGGMWIKLTVCGVTRLGYGDAQGKTGGDAMKERIGDALRNAAMRFGAALDLWHKGDLHIDEPETTEKKETFKSEPKSEWDKLDEETKAWMLNEAMALTVLTNDGDIVGAYQHLESLKLDDSYKTAFWSRLDSKQRSAIRAYSSIINAKDLNGLQNAWATVPKHAQASLESVKENRKQELLNSTEETA